MIIKIMNSFQLHLYFIQWGMIIKIYKIYQDLWQKTINTKIKNKNLRRYTHKKIIFRKKKVNGTNGTMKISIKIKVKEKCFKLCQH
jgi:hypothetical protein